MLFWQHLLPKLVTVTRQTDAHPAGFLNAYKSCFSVTKVLQTPQNRCTYYWLLTVFTPRTATKPNWAEVPAEKIESKVSQK
jgi:hypothetical protein